MDHETAKIVMGKPISYYYTKRIYFGYHALIYISMKNPTKKISVPTIALIASNQYWGCHLISFYSGNHIHGYHCEELPIKDDVIKQVEEIAQKEK